MSNKALSAQEVLATLEGFVSDEDNINALYYVESIVLPIITDLEKLSHPSIFHSIIYNISNILYLNQRYEEAWKYLGIISGTEFSRHSVECIMLQSLLMNKQGDYSASLAFLSSAQS